MKLQEIWEQTIRLEETMFPGHGFSPIFGGGSLRPRFMFVFINPTAKNISSSKEWQGPRYPFIGTKHIWRVFNKAGMLDDDLMNTIETRDWTVEFSYNVLEHLKEQGFYFTNIVKHTGHDAALPQSDLIKLFLPILNQEILAVMPKYIVTFGLIPYRALTGEGIRLSDMHKGSIDMTEAVISKKKFNIIPCYFPVGRGNPKKAVELLRKLRELQ